MEKNDRDDAEITIKRCEMTKKLFLSAVTKFALGVVLAGALIFVPAGTFDFPGGQLFMAVCFGPMLVAGIVMMVKAPELLKRRLDAKEKQKDQGALIKLSGLMFIVGFVVAGLNHRFGWYTLPWGVSIGGAVAFLFAYAVFAEVLRENEYLSRTIEVAEGQRVVDTGLYGIVRHPMYSVTLLLFIAMPVILGSVYSLVAFLFYPLIIVRRLKGEEEFLKKELPGYEDYMKKVKYRLIPFIW